MQERACGGSIADSASDESLRDERMQTQRRERCGDFDGVRVEPVGDGFHVGQARCACDLWLRRFPILGVFDEFLFYLRPVVQIGRVEIGIVGPDQCSHFGVESYLVE